MIPLIVDDDEFTAPGSAGVGAVTGVATDIVVEAAVDPVATFPVTVVGLPLSEFGILFTPSASLQHVAGLFTPGDINPDPPPTPGPIDCCDCGREVGTTVFAATTEFATATSEGPVPVPEIAETAGVVCVRVTALVAVATPGGCIPPAGPTLAPIGRTFVGCLITFPRTEDTVFATAEAPVAIVAALAVIVPQLPPLLVVISEVTLVLVLLVGTGFEPAAEFPAAAIETTAVPEITTAVPGVVAMSTFVLGVEAPAAAEIFPVAGTMDAEASPKL